MLTLRSLSLAYLLCVVGCGNSPTPAQTSDVPEIGNFQKLAPFQEGLPTLQMPPQLAKTKPGLPNRHRGGAVNFEWHAPDLIPPFPLLIVEVIQKTKTGEEARSSSLMAWDRPTSDSSNNRIFRAQLKIPEEPGGYVIRIRDPDTLYTQLDVEVLK